MAARRPDRAAEGASDRARRMGRGAALGDHRRSRRCGPRRAEGIREARHPAAAGQGRYRQHVRRRLCRRPVAPRRAARRRRWTRASADAADEHDPGAQRRPQGRRCARDADIVVFGEDIGYFGGVFRVTEGLQKEFGKTRTLRRADQRGRDRRHRGRHGRLRHQAGDRDPVRRLYLSRLRPDRQRSRQDPLPHRRRMDDADGHPHALWRRHLRRPDAQPVAGKPVHPYRRAEGGDPVDAATTPRAC